MRIVFMGTPQYSAQVLHTLINHNAGEIVAVVTTPDRRRGRGITLEAATVKHIAPKLLMPPAVSYFFIFKTWFKAF
mgnify:CR=1 FL=1